MLHTFEVLCHFLRIQKGVIFLYQPIIILLLLLIYIKINKFIRVQHFLLFCLYNALNTLKKVSTYIITQLF